MVAHFTNTLRIDREQAQRQLQLLGDKPGDKVCLTAFFPKGDPRTKGENKDKGRKSDRLNYAEIEAWQAQGRGVYLVANGYGHGKDDVRLCRTIFYEHDDLSKDIQLTLWQSLGMPEPTFQVDTEGKSIHNYWVLEEPIHPELWAFQESDGTWKGLQADLLHFAAADTSLTNPNRVMRLAGAWYMQWDEEQQQTVAIAQSKIVGGCGKRYSYAELRGIIPRQQPQPEPRRRNNQQQDSSNDLLDFRSVGHQLPYWSDNGRKGWATFQCPVHTGDGKKHSTDHIHVNLGNGAWEAHCGCDRKLIYQTVCDMVGHKPTGRSFSGGIGSGGNGGGRRGGSGGSGSGGDRGDGGDGRKILRFPATELNMAAIREQIKGILSQDLPPSELEATKIQIRVAAPAISERELRQLWNAVELELELEQSRGDRAKEIDDLVKLGDQSLNLSDFLPADLSRPVGAWCQWLSIRPEAALTALLSATSSLHKSGTELVISRKQNFSVPPTIYGALISESGQKKSPIYRTLVRQPLDALEIDAEEQFKAAMQDWREEMKVWQANGGQGEAPVEPVPPPIWYFTDANGEGIKAQAHKHPSKSLMGLVDELAGLFNSHDKYRNGKGSDRQDMLSYFDGTGAKVLRASGVKVNVRKLYLSLFGTIQPDVLKRMMSDCSDPDGQWARFLFVNQPLTASELDDDNYSVDIVERITDFYRWLDKVPEMEYTLSKAAYERYKPVYKQLERLRVSHPQAGMRAMYAKLEGYVGRLAINLHAFHEWAAFKVAPDAEIPLEIMERAIALAKFYIGQVKLVHFNSDDSELAPTLVRLINYSKLLESVGKDGWVKAKDFVNTITKNKRPKVDVARSWMREAESLGFGCTRGIGCHLEYHWKSDNKPDSPPDLTPKKVDGVDKKETKVDESSTAEMTIYQAFQEKVDEVDDLSTFSNHPLDNTQYCAEEQNTSSTFEVEHNISGDSSTSSTFFCNDRISMVPEVDESSTFYLPENQASTFSATGSVSTIDAVNSEIASASLAADDTVDEEEQGNEDLEEWGTCRCAEEMDVYVRGEEGIWTVTKSLPAYAELESGSRKLIRGWSDIRVSI